MNQLLLFRLIIATTQLVLLGLNQWLLLWYPPVDGLWVVCGGYVLVLVGLYRTEPTRVRSRWLLVTDALIWTVFLSQLGGVSNPIVWCLLLPTVLSALSQSMVFTWFLTGLANALYALLWWLNPESSLIAHHGDMMASHITGMWLGFIATSVILTWVTTALMQRLQQKNDALRQLEKQQQADESLLRMATLATSLTHELGTPLTSIRLLIEEIRQDIKDPVVYRDLDLVDSQVSRCKAVLERMTQLADTRTADVIQWQDAQAFISQLAEDTELGTMTCEVVQVPEQQVLIQVDDAFELAINNVLNNSLAAGASQVRIAMQLVAGRLRLSLSDDGAGVSYKNPEGLGMGLKLSSRIISSLGGHLSFQPTSSGAVTTIEVPCKHA